MKKVAILLLFLTMVLLSAFPQESVQAMVTGEVKSDYNVNFNNWFHGLETLASVGIQLNFGKNYETESYQKYHGYLKISGLDLINYNLLEYSSGSDRIEDWEILPIFHTDVENISGSNNYEFSPNIEAKISLQPFYIKLDNNIELSAEQEFETGKIKDQVLLEDTGVDQAAEPLEHNIITLDAKQLCEPSGVLAIGFVSELLNAEFKFSTQTTGNLDGEFIETRSYRSRGLALGLQLSSEPLTDLSVNFGVYKSFNYIDLMRYTGVNIYSGYVDVLVEDPESGITNKLLEVVSYDSIVNNKFMTLIDNPLLASLKVGYRIPLIRQMSLKPFAGCELLIHSDYDATLTGEDFAEAEIGAGVDFIVPLPELEEKNTGMGLAFADWSGTNNEADSQGATLYVSYKHSTDETNPGGAVSLKTTFYDKVGYGSFIPVIGLSFIGIVNNLILLDGYLANLNFGAGLYVNARLADKFLPFLYTDLWCEFGAGISTPLQSRYLDAGTGIEITILDNTVFLVKYASGNLFPLQKADRDIGELHAEIIISYN